MPIARGDLAPEFSLLRRDGGLFRFSEAPRPLLLAFFKTSCPTCRVELPFLQKLNDAYVTFPLYAVSQSSGAETGAFCSEFGLRIPILLEDKPWEVSASYGLVAVPTAFLIDEDGFVSEVAEGWSRAGINLLAEKVAGLLGQKAVMVSTPDDGAPEWKPG